MINKDQIASISSYILDGLSEDESCLMCNIDPSELRELKEKSKDVRNHIEKQKIQFKLAHLKEMQTRKSDKNSQWLLEKLIPEQFGNQKRNDAPTINIISQIIKNIQDGESTSKIAPRTRGELLNGGDEPRDIYPTEPILK